ncbi:hypothetical protein DICSQDRAFT_81142 [Dichomitus squalens LYAD-421 SS1]|uniref:Uncharacterized protein n=1 Tax=Dichomitus squalens TaxID=114155 RepID=A0A4Q9MLT4_9APHY|nr:uncharacterized protein DICSQDRAFT_81142 [Dichomitus squalens LYAD-421 SS1]EJF64124.1 hypothetical protein DICSQDRAFT_81142 [Dichomitus squalens LYAD-421 SS1]TBU27272.1 hypothetical protein BD311DRAFT_760775 [Dichomitus squalens]
MSSISTYDDPPSRSLHESSDLSSLREREDVPIWEPRNLCSALESASKRASLYERQIKDLESKLSLDLSNSRAIENLLQEVFTGLEHTRGRADFSLTHTVPHIADSLEEDLAVLVELEEQLPEVGHQIRDIRKVYDRGRDKAQQLMASLEWLNTPVSQRLRTIIFTEQAPVSKRWKVLVRTIFALVFCACMWIAYITLRGAVRAHRQRLVWGERLPS